MMDADQKQKEAEAEKKIREQLLRLKNFLLKQSSFKGDNLSWAAGCIQSFLEGDKKTLDHAFGLRSSKTGPKPMQSGEQDDWVVAAWFEVNEATPDDKEWPDTETMAEIGRCFGLGGKDNANADSHGIASELKRTLKRYQRIIAKQLNAEIAARWNEEQ